MKLFIDTSNAEKIVIGLDGEKFESSARQKTSQKLLPSISEILNKYGSSIKEITEIEENRGPGSFTGLRVGVSVANALGWTLGIPVNGKKVLKGKPLDIKYSS